MKNLIILFIIFSFSALGKTYKLSDDFMKEMMCVHNMGEQYCRAWVKKSVVNLVKYRKIEEGCINGVQILCHVVAEVQNRKPTAISGQLVALSEFGCASGNGAHCLILASIDVRNARKYLNTGCKFKNLTACKKLRSGK